MPGRNTLLHCVVGLDPALLLPHTECPPPTHSHKSLACSTITNKSSLWDLLLNICVIFTAGKYWFGSFVYCKANCVSLSVACVVVLVAVCLCFWRITMHWSRSHWMLGLHVCSSWLFNHVLWVLIWYLWFCLRIYSVLCQRHLSLYISPCLVYGCVSVHSSFPLEFHSLSLVWQTILHVGIKHSMTITFSKLQSILDVSWNFWCQC